MRPILGIAMLLSFLVRWCDMEFPIERGQHGPGAAGSGNVAGTGSAEQPDAGVRADGGAGDAGMIAPDAGGGAGAVGLPAGGSSAAGAPMNQVDAGGSSAPGCDAIEGLYQPGSCNALADGVREYRPQYPLWSDGAQKRRYIYLPPGQVIDTSNPDRWNFPVGTRLYKDFAVDGRMIETRVMIKTSPAPGVGSWTMTAYAWNADQTGVAAADTNGVSDALGTQHDIPSQAQCKFCHTMQGGDAVNGFGAIQLNHADDGTLTLAELLDAALLANGSGAAPNVTLDNAKIPGTAEQQAGLGYLHGNCGHCHGGPAPKAGMPLWATVGATALTQLPAYQGAICQCLQHWTGRSNPAGEPYVLRISPGHAELSGIIGRMSTRAAGEQMPPIGTKLVDMDGLASVEAFINSLDPASCDATADTCSSSTSP